MPITSNILSTGEIKRLLTSLNIKLSKKRGQNFLVNERRIEQILDCLEINSDTKLLEIGGGIGALTIPVALNAAHTFVYEIDQKLSQVLQKRVEEVHLQDRVSILQEDFLTAAWPTVKKPLNVYSSLPYSITSPVIHKLVEQHFSVWNKGTFLMQKEVAEKIVKSPPTASYWYHFLNYYYDVKVVMPTIPPSDFWPQPGVNSSLLQLSQKNDDTLISPDQWSSFLHEVFTFPRKTIGHSFAEDVLEKAGINPQIRPGEATTSDLQSLYEVIQS